ncbi:MAG: M20 family metallo-hydrolase [Hyphomonadaceae bacterium]
MNINGARLNERLTALSRIGATPDGGVTRLALSLEDRQARALLLGWALARGFEVGRDVAGNLFIARRGTNSGLPPLMTGSHLDTQRNGGNFDGIYGVVAGLEVIESLEDANVRTNADFVVTIWNNEEGVRYGPVTMGSSIWSGKLRLDDLITEVDSDGVSLGAALEQDRAELFELAAWPLQSPFQFYVELHIEQGPVLDAADTPIGVVTGIQGVRQFLFKVQGEAAHAGTTPMAARKDAFSAALELCERLKEIAVVSDPAVRFTIGRFVVSPGAPNTIPAEVTFTVDFRSPDTKTLRERGAAMLAAAGEVWGPCLAEVKEFIHSEPVSFDAEVMAAIRSAAVASDLAFLELPSGATHDALHVARIGAAGMIFVPSRDGVSHNPREWTDPGHLTAGCQVLASAMRSLDRAR